MNSLTLLPGFGLLRVFKKLILIIFAKILAVLWKNGFSAVLTLCYELYICYVYICYELYNTFICYVMLCIYMYIYIYIYML